MDLEARPRVRVLVVDDDATTRLVAAGTLAHADFDVVEAQNGDEAIDRFVAHAPDLVLLDVDMPGRNGFEVCAWIRATSGDRRHVPIVMLTGMDDLASVTRAYESGATDFIVKPVHPPSLAHRVRYVLRASAALRELRAAEADNRAMLAAIPDAMLRIAATGRVLSFHRGHGALPFPIDDACVGKSVQEALPAVVAEVVLGQMSACGEGAPLQSQELPLQVGDRVTHLECRCVLAAGTEVLLFLRDITDRIDTQKRVHELAYTDSLTGLPNRQAFLETLERELVRVGRRQSALAVVFLDLDGFKRVNDTLGHTVGDHLLQAVAGRLRQFTRPSDVVARSSSNMELARLGGDEFTILLPDVVRPEHALAVAHRMREALKRPFVIDLNEIIVTASIGISFYPDDAQDAASLIQYADTAMYDAKESGRDACRLYSAALTERVMQRVSLESGLRKALAAGELVLHYQPQIGGPEGRIFGMEALLRWRHPQRGVLPPLEFLSMAEETGLIVPIGEWVLRTACMECRDWQAQTGERVRVGVNISAVQFRAENFVEMVLATLAATGLAPDLLDLEITESTLMDNTESALAKLHALKRAGIALSIDDFGTGYSSMSYLKRFPVSTLKIDRAFLEGLPDDAQNAAILRAIIAMARGLHVDIIAEGVENAAQAATLAQLGCDEMQGFHFGRPLPADEARTLLMQRGGASRSRSSLLAASGTSRCPH